MNLFISSNKNMGDVKFSVSPAAAHTFGAPASRPWAKNPSLPLSDNQAPRLKKDQAQKHSSLLTHLLNQSLLTQPAISANKFRHLHVTAFLPITYLPTAQLLSWLGRSQDLCRLAARLRFVSTSLQTFGGSHFCAGQMMAQVEAQLPSL